MGGDGGPDSGHRHAGRRGADIQMTPQMTVFGGMGGVETRAVCR